MTAISAAIVELKAHCEHTWEVIRSLERFARVVEEAHEKAATAVQVSTAFVDFPEPATRPTRRVKGKGKAAKKAAPVKAAAATPAKTNGTPAHAGSGAQTATYAGGAAIIGRLGVAGDPLSPTDLIRLTKLPRWRVMKTLLLMHASGQLAKVGARRSAKYALPTKPRSGAAAGTQAAPPVGPPSANGRQASSGGFEVAWNGTKERNGEAPPILSAAGRERKA